MGVANALKFTLQTIAHRVGSYEHKNICMVDKNRGDSNFISPGPSAQH
jgi:hypothetical protein